MADPDPTAWMCRLIWQFIPYLFGLYFAFHVVVFKILLGMANRVEPEQQEQSDLGLTFCICHFIVNFGVQNYRTFIISKKGWMNIKQC